MSATEVLPTSDACQQELQPVLLFSKRRSRSTIATCLVSGSHQITWFKNETSIAALPSEWSFPVHVSIVLQEQYTFKPFLFMRGELDHEIVPVIEQSNISFRFKICAWCASQRSLASTVLYTHFSQQSRSVESYNRWLSITLQYSSAVGRST